MKISIAGIETRTATPIGHTKMNSYPVHFKSAMFEGLARFVPGGEDLETYLNREIEVEISHEKISGLRTVNSLEHQVTPLTQVFGYHVRGEVKLITPHSEPAGNRTTYIVAGDAVFALTLSDIGAVRPREGETVEFDVHGLSLWDELI
jgi:hypothetical protein